MDKQVRIIGERVKKLREQLEYSLQDVGKYCGCTKQNIEHIENGKSNTTSLSILKKLSKLLACTPDYLSGNVDQCDQTISKTSTTDSNGESMIETHIYTNAIRNCDFQGHLIQQILFLPEDRQYRLDKILNFFHTSDNTELQILENFIDAWVPTKEQFIETKTNPKYYIYQKITSSIMPELCKYAYDFIYSSKITPSIEKCNLEDNAIRAHINQHLGDFKKESKQKLNAKIRAAVIGHKNEIQSLHKFSVFKEDILEIVENYLRYTYDLFTQKLIEDDSIFKHSHFTKTENLRMSYLQGLQKYLNSTALETAKQLKKILKSSKTNKNVSSGGQLFPPFISLCITKNQSSRYELVPPPKKNNEFGTLLVHYFLIDSVPKQSKATIK